MGLRGRSDGSLRGSCVEAECRADFFGVPEMNKNISPLAVLATDLLAGPRRF